MYVRLSGPVLVLYSPRSLQLSTHEVVEVCGKILYQVELARNTLNTMWGFSVEAELVENNEKQVRN